MSTLQRESSWSSIGSSECTLNVPDPEADVAKVHVTDRLKRYITQKRLYNYFGPFTAEEVSIKRVRLDEDGVGLYDIHVQCLGNISWMITLRYAQLYESYKWQVKYDKDLKLPLTFQFPPKKFCKVLDEEELEERREGLEKWINGRISLIHNYESEEEIMKNIEKEMSFLLKIGQHGPSLHQYNRNTTVTTISSDMRESTFSTDEFDEEEDRSSLPVCEADQGKIVIQESEVATANMQFDESNYDAKHVCNTSKSKAKNTNKRAVLPIKEEPSKGHNEDSAPPSPLEATLTPASSYLFMQCRSIWVPKNWLYVAVSAVVCTLWLLDIHVVYTVLFVCCSLESSRRLEDHLLFANHADIRSDREYSLSGMVRLVFIGLIVLCYVVLHVVHFAFARSATES